MYTTKKLYNNFIFLILFISLTNSVFGNKSVFITLDDNLFVKTKVPPMGVACSNVDRVFRLKDLLDNVSHFQTSWGTNVFIGTYKNQPFFIVNAPVGAGSGLVFTELYAAGAQFIVRFGSDDKRNPEAYETKIVKIIDEADNLFGFNEGSGVAPQYWGKSVFASPLLLEAFTITAKRMDMATETRICHHLENYHALRKPDKFSQERAKRLKRKLAQLKRKDKPESFDMETAVLFRVAKDFDAHAISILQTVDKESKDGAYKKGEVKTIYEQERQFMLYIMESLLQVQPLIDAYARHGASLDK